MYISMTDNHHPDQSEFTRQVSKSFNDLLAMKSPNDETQINNSLLLDDENSFHGNDATDSGDTQTATSSNCTTADPMSIDSDEQNSEGEELDSSTTHVPIDNDLPEVVYDNNLPEVVADDLPEVAIDNDLECDSYDFGTPDHASSRVVPTPVNVNLNEIVVPIEDFTNTQEHIKERKYPVLPSIGQRSRTMLSSSDSESNDTNDNSSTINQLDFTREKMEVEADFFADYRINTSKVKVTPRQNPLPPIRQTSSVSTGRGKRWCV